MLSNTDISHYHILLKLGAGGMGEVYLAEDTRLHRNVALKVLPPEVAANRERMRRFHQEATSAAALSHPNIAQIFEIGEHEGTHYIAMEFIEGVTLREKIHREPTELRKLLRYLQHVAEGLAKAHAAGIIHRDLKPDNIMVTHEGHAKILDFGLAKLIEPIEPTGQKPEREGGLSDVATALMEQHSKPGMILGTAGYMSPEQAQGRTNQVDHRSDIFSFGCILYEAITRSKAFEGKDLIDTLNQIIREPVPPISDLNPTAPADLHRIVRRCLAKDPEDRYQTVKDVAIELKEVRRELQGAEQHTTGSPSAVMSTAGPSQSLHHSATINADSLSTRASSAEYIVSEIKRHRKGLVLALALIFIVIASASFAWYKLANRSRSERPVSFATAKFTRLTTSGKVTDAAISPDGKYVALVVEDAGMQSLWVRQIATQSNVEIVQPSENQFIGLAFSPDGNYVYYSVRERIAGLPLGDLYQVPSLGGAARKVLTEIVTPVSFSPDGKRFAYLSHSTSERENSLMIANADGSGARRLARKSGKERFVGGGNSSVSWSPDGKTIVSQVRNVLENYMTVVAVSVESGEIKSFTPQKWPGVNGAAWLADGGGLLVTAREPAPSQQSQIWQVSYPEGVAHRVTNDLIGYESLSLDANSDTLVTVQGEQVANIWVMPADDTAHATRITVGRRNDRNPSWTPAGAVVYDSNASGNWELYLIDAHGGNARQITANSGYLNVFPSVSPDGRYIAFCSGTPGGGPHIWRIDIDGFNRQQLTNQWDMLPQWSPDSEWIVYESQAGSGIEIWKVAVNGGQPVRIHEKFTRLPTVSPDGKQFACYYRDDPNAPFKLAVLPIEGGQPTKTFDASDALRLLRWTADGRGIVYVLTRGGVSNLWAQPLDGGQPKQLTNFTSDLIFSFDVSRDGKQLALSRGTVTSDVVLISNFR